MLEKLGSRFAEARETSGRSLAAVAEPAQISPAYLQKLERGEVGSPSPKVLRRVATVLGVPYLETLVLAGYLSKDERRQVEADPKMRVESHPLRDQKLSPDEWKAVGAFIKYLKSS